MGAMELFEFVSQMMRRLSHKEGFELPGGGRTVVQSVMALFKELDADGSGEISMAEFCEGVAQSDDLWELFTVMNPFASFTPKPLLDKESEAEREAKLKHQLSHASLEEQAATDADEPVLGEDSEPGSKPDHAAKSPGWFTGADPSSPAPAKTPVPGFSKPEPQHVNASNKGWFTRSGS